MERVELTMIQIDVTIVESKMLGCFFAALYSLRDRSVHFSGSHLHRRGELCVLLVNVDANRLKAQHISHVVESEN